MAETGTSNTPRAHKTRNNTEFLATLNKAS